MKTYFWTAETTAAIKEYLSLGPSAKRDRLFAISILPALNIIISSELNQLRLADNEDLRQDAIVKALDVFKSIIDYTTAQSFVTTSIRRYIRQYAMLKNPLVKYNDVSNDNEMLLTLIPDQELPPVESKEELSLARQRFIKSIKDKIDQQQALNSTRVALLSMLIDYAEANEYELAGFVPYCADQLKLTIPYIRVVASTLEIKCKPLM